MSIVRCLSNLLRVPGLRREVSTPKVIHSPILEQVRSTSFFTKHTAEQLWKGVTSVSNAGRKRGRGRGAGRKVIKDLNRGQVIGRGKINMVWPGLNSPVVRGRELVQQQNLGEDPDREANLAKLRGNMGSYRSVKLLPIERGWSGTRLPGRSVGPPDPVGDDTFEGFNSKVLEMKAVFNVTGNLGKKRRMSIFVVTGNGDGLAGFGLGKAVDTRAALKSAKNRAGQRLMFFERYNDHTIFHDFFSQFGKTKLFVHKKPEGYGLVCHRAIKCICEVIGIKDLYAKVEGSTNLQHVVKAFFIGLLKQKTHESMAAETGHYLVEMRKENSYFPRLIAAPPEPNSDPKAQPPDFEQFEMDGKVVLKRKKFPKFYMKTYGWEKHLKKTLRFRNMDEVKIKLHTAKKYYSDPFEKAIADTPLRHRR